jgi:hypothetical protein
VLRLGRFFFSTADGMPPSVHHPPDALLFPAAHGSYPNNASIFGSFESQGHPIQFPFENTLGNVENLRSTYCPLGTTTSAIDNSDLVHTADLDNVPLSSLPFVRSPGVDFPPPNLPIAQPAGPSNRLVPGSFDPLQLENAVVGTPFLYGGNGYQFLTWGEYKSEETEDQLGDHHNTFDNHVIANTSPGVIFSYSSTSQDQLGTASVNSHSALGAFMQEIEMKPGEDGSNTIEPRFKDHHMGIDSLNEHLGVSQHRADSKLKCQWRGCPSTRSFGRVADLKRHVETFHIAPVNHRCVQRGCGRTFTRKDKLQEHVRKSHLSQM